MKQERDITVADIKLHMIGTKRYYYEDLTKRDYRLETTTPFRMIVSGKTLQETSWGGMIQKLCVFMLEKDEKKKEGLFGMECSWTKKEIFRKGNSTNYRKVLPDLFVNCNHTALHSCWLLQDILDYFGIDKSETVLMIHRPPSMEPKEVKEAMYAEFCEGFSKYLIENYGKSKDYIQRVIANIEKHLNPILQKITKSYCDFFQFDDATYACEYAKDVRKYIMLHPKMREENKTILNKYLDWICEYYKADSR